MTDNKLRGDEFRCPDCKEINKAWDKKCKKCNKDFGEPTQEQFDELDARNREIKLMGKANEYEREKLLRRKYL